MFFPGIIVILGHIKYRKINIPTTMMITKIWIGHLIDCQSDLIERFNI